MAISVGHILNLDNLTLSPFCLFRSLPLSSQQPLRMHRTPTWQQTFKRRLTHPPEDGNQGLLNLSSQNRRRDQAGVGTVGTTREERRTAAIASTGRERRRKTRGVGGAAMSFERGKQQHVTSVSVPNKNAPLAGSTCIDGRDGIVVLLLLYTALIVMIDHQGSRRLLVLESPDFLHRPRLSSKL